MGSGQRLTFSDGEAKLFDWMAGDARVCWVATPAPWTLESVLITQLTLPLNLDQNRQSGFRDQRSALRAQQRLTARELPVVPR